VWASQHARALSAAAGLGALALAFTAARRH